MPLLPFDTDEDEAVIAGPTQAFNLHFFTASLLTGDTQSITINLRKTDPQSDTLLCSILPLPSMPTPSRFQSTPKRLGSTATSSSSSTTITPSRTSSMTTPSKHPFSSSSSTHHKPTSTNTPGSASKRDSCLEQIQLLQRNRAERRKSMEEKRAERAKEEKRLHDSGMPGDVDFQRMIGSFRTEHGLEPHPHIPPGDLKICICVRKRPINEKERKRKDYDAVTCFNPVVMVHDCRLRVDGITKYLENTDFAFDHTFGEEETTEKLYRYTAAPLVPFMFQQGRATCFAYGQTGRCVDSGGREGGRGGQDGGCLLPSIIVMCSFVYYPISLSIPVSLLSLPP